jgi:hypothetical protein
LVILKKIPKFRFGKKNFTEISKFFAENLFCFCGNFLFLREILDKTG